MKIGNTIKRLRKQKGMTLNAMSELIGIQEATLSRIENDLMDGGLNTYMLIAGGSRYAFKRVVCGNRG